MRTFIHNGKEYTFGNVEENGVVRELTDEEAIKFAELKDSDDVKAAEFQTLTWRRNRQAEYPSLDDLIVALWESVVEERMASVTALEALRQAVKTKYPKP